MADNRPSRSWIDRATAWSPVLLLGGLAALTYWLDAQVQPPAPRRDGSTRHDADIFAEGVHVLKLDPEGRPLQSLSARRAEHFADDQIDAFWAKPETERAAIWGRTFDLAAALAEFQPMHIPDE